MAEDAGAGGAEEFKPSERGTKAYWDAAYARELGNLEENEEADVDDVSEVWFTYDSIKRAVDWIERRSGLPKGTRFLDLGCGNAAVLLELAQRGYTCLTGVDYSQGAIELAARLAASRSTVPITLEVHDMLASPYTPPSGAPFDVAIDRGTFDAVSLSQEGATNRQLYIAAVGRVVTPGGLFILTSCNWTKAEVLSQFSTEFDYFDEVATPQFRFGGQTGAQYCIVILRRKL